jgi:hypothetical protein
VASYVILMDETRGFLSLVDSVFGVFGKDGYFKIGSR